MTRLLSTVRALAAILVLASTAKAQGPSVTAAFPNNLSGTPGTLLYRQINLGRVTNIAYHNGLVYTHEVGAANPRRWSFTDVEDPASLTIQATGWQYVGNFSDHGTHGHYKVGDWLGGQWAVNIRRVSDGLNTIQDMPEFTSLGATQPGDGITRMYYPWGLAFNWIEYGAAPGYGFIHRGNQQLASWPALAQHGVAGNSILLGNLLFITSDESNMGILCYDISPVFQTPAQPPALLDKLSGPVGAYIVYPWEHYLILSRRDTDTVDIVDFSDPTNLQFVTSISVAGHPDRDNGNGLGYVQCQDNYIFADRHKIDMDTFQPVLEIDEIGNNRPAGSVAGVLDTSQHLMPMGNLLVSGGYSHAGADGVGVWIHSPEPDRNPPYVGYHIPRPGQTNFPLGAPVSLLIHENLESYTILNGQTVILRPAGGAAIDATVSFSYDDVLTITPTEYLQPDTTYEVEIVAGGIKDVAGNGILPYSFSFSTGASVAGGNASPQISSFSASPSPTTPGTEVTLSAAATDADGDSLEYRFTFGENGAVREWDADPTAAHTFATAGHFGVKVQVRDVRTGTPLSTVSQTGTVSVVPAPPAVRPAKSSPIALDAPNRRVWVVNPDNDSVSVIDADTRLLISEIDLNELLSLTGSIDPRGVAIDPSGNAWIACRDADRLAIVNPAGVLLESHHLGHGSAPMGIAVSPDGSTAFLTLESRGQLRRFSTATRQQTGSLNLGPSPRAIAVTADGSRVLVTRFISGEEYGQVYDVNAAAMTLTRTIPLHRDRGGDGSSSGRGVPNFVSSITISPDGQFAYYTAVKSNTQRGAFFNQDNATNNPLDPDNTVRAMVGRISLSSNNEPFASDINTYRIDVDNSESPTALEFTPSGDYFFVTAQGNNHVAVYDDLLLRTAPRSLAVKTTKGRFATGLAPQGIVFDPVGNRLFSADFMGRSVTVHDLGPFLAFGNRDTDRLAVSTITTEKLSPEVLLGKRIFYQAADASGLSTLPTLSLEGYISCASCHVDGQHDGMTWDFTDRGEGFRNTTDLRGRAGVSQGNVHWSGNFDEIQDFVLDVMNEIGGGQGLLPPGETPHPPLGTPNAGRSAELDALAAYVSSLADESLPRSPHRNADGTRTPSAEAGADVFTAAGCAGCHAGNHYTGSSSSGLHDVGTLRTSSGNRLGDTLGGIDTPTLRGLWAGAPYFHDGSAKTLDEVFRVAGGTIYQAEDATLGAGVVQPGYPTLNEDSSMHGQMVYLGSGETVTFQNVDGGTTAGQGDLELRWMAPYWGSPGTLTVTVNGNPHQVPVTRPFGSGNPGDHWQRIRIENVALTAGTTNTLVVTTTGNDSGFDDLLVTTPDQRTAASAHRSALTLPPQDYDNLRDFILQLDGSSDAPLENPTLTITPVQTSPSSSPFAEFDVVFSEPVTGLSANDLTLGGTAGTSARHLTTIGPATYRLRVAGFTQSGSITVQLPDASVTAIDDSLPNSGSPLASLDFLKEDDILRLSDEFDNPATLPEWHRNEVEEGWGINKLETWDIDTSRPGHMRLVPHSSSWYENWTGAYAYKPVTGDFVATMRMRANRRNGLSGRPSSAYSLGGIMVRTPRGLTNAAPVPDPGPNVVLPWPPPPLGQPNHYTTPWQPGTENYIFLSFGNADTAWGNVPDTWYCEVKTTINSVSTLYAVQSGIPANNDLITLQFIRRGPVFLLLRRHGDGPWIIENRFVRNDMPATLQVGITTYTDWNSVSGQNEFHHNRTVFTGGNPDLVADAEYFRLRRPPATLTGTDLQEVPITGLGAPPSLLQDSSLAAVLGDPLDNTGGGSSYNAWLGTHFAPAQLANPAISADDADPDHDGLPNLIDYLVGGSPLVFDSGLRIQRANGATTLQANRDTRTRGYHLIVEVTGDFDEWEILAESVNGAVPTGPGFGSETAGLVRTFTVTDTTPSAPRRYFRLRAVAEEN
jgi:DNA-binding beta-propeller fold protein YncE